MRMVIRGDERTILGRGRMVLSWMSGLVVAVAMKLRISSIVRSIDGVGGL